MNLENGSLVDGNMINSVYCGTLNALFKQRVLLHSQGKRIKQDVSNRNDDNK